MPVSPKFYAKLEYGSFYHIYNRSNSSKNVIFYKPENYAYFLRLVRHNLGSFLNVWAYCLLPNHFHIMARITNNSEDVNEKVVRAFQRVFISYSQAINKQEKVRGSVFQKRFKRIHVDSEVYLSRLLFYIHYNPVSHGLVRNISDWEFSSFHALRSSKPTSIAREEVLEWFGGLDAFEKFHSSDTSGDGGMKDYGVE